MRLSELLLCAVQSNARRRAERRNERPGDRTTYRHKTRQHGGMTFVGIPNKIARRMGAKL